MRKSKIIFYVLLSLILAMAFSCKEKKTGEQESEEKTESISEHQRDYNKGEGEETATELALSAKHDMVLNGARLILTYDAKSKSFVGTVENTTHKKLEKIRVEVQLSNGLELGPTAPVDLEAGKKMDIKLNTTSEGFDGWTAHLEVSAGEKDGHGEEQ